MRKQFYHPLLLFIILSIWAVGSVGTAQAETVCHPTPAGLSGWWQGDDSLDDVIGGRDAILHDDATIGPGLIRQAFVLDGDGDFVEVPHDPALNLGTDDFTVALWARFNDTAGEQVLIENRIQHSSAPPAPSPTPTPHLPAVQLLYPKLTGAFIELQAEPLRPGLWARMQWQDAFGGWHDIEGWQGAFNENRRVLWYIDEEHLGDGPFRWLVDKSQGGDLLAVSQPFSMPSRGGEVLRVEVSLPTLDKATMVVTSLPEAPVTASTLTPWLRAHPVWDSVDAWSWPQDAVLHLIIDDPATPAAPDLEMDMPGKVDPDLGSVWFDFAGAYDLKPGDEVTLSDGATTRHLVVSVLTIEAVDVEADTAAGTVEAGASVRLPTPGEALFVTADSKGAWYADLHEVGFDLVPGTMVIAESYDEDGDLTSYEWEGPQGAKIISLGKPVIVTTNGADDDREKPGVEPADITDGRLDYLPAGDAQDDGTVGYVNDDYNQLMVITATIDLQGTYDISRIRYHIGHVLGAGTWNADLMTTPLGTTPTNPGTPDTGAWTEHTGRATLSSVTIVLEKTRVSYATDWLFIGEIEVYGIPSGG